MRRFALVLCRGGKRAAAWRFSLIGRAQRTVFCAVRPKIHFGKDSDECLADKSSRTLKHWAAGPRGMTALPSQNKIGTGYTARFPDISRPEQANQPAGQLPDSGKARQDTGCSNNGVRAYWLPIRLLLSPRIPAVGSGDTARGLPSGGFLRGQEPP